MNGIDMISIVLDELEHMDWYADIIYSLKNFSCPYHLTNHKRRALRLNVAKYCLIQGDLGWRNLDGLVLRGVNKKSQRGSWKSYIRRIAVIIMQLAL